MDKHPTPYLMKHVLEVELSNLLVTKIQKNIPLSRQKVLTVHQYHIAKQVNYHSLTTVTTRENDSAHF